MLTIGDRFPEFKQTAVVSLEKGKEFAELSSADYPGKWKVVFFWPKDFTFVCPTEIAEFGRRFADFRARGAEVLGASTDTHYVHLAWRKDHPDLRQHPWTPVTHPAFGPRPGDGDEQPDVFAPMRTRDVLVHYPYHSFATSVERFVKGGPPSEAGQQDDLRVRMQTWHDQHDRSARRRKKE